AADQGAMRTITHAGITDSLAGWQARTRIPASTIKSRLDAGWDVARALTTPPDRRFRKGGRHKAGAPRPCPTLREHASGQAYCRWSVGGKEQCRYFGVWGTAAATKAYRQFQVEWAAGVTPKPAGVV